MTDGLSNELIMPLLEAHTPEQVREAYRRLVLTNSKEFPNLYALECKRNAYNFNKR